MEYNAADYDFGYLEVERPLEVEVELDAELDAVRNELSYLITFAELDASEVLRKDPVMLAQAMYAVTLELWLEDPAMARAAVAYSDNPRKMHELYMAHHQVTEHDGFSDYMVSFYEDTVWRDPLYEDDWTSQPFKVRRGFIKSSGGDFNIDSRKVFEWAKYWLEGDDKYTPLNAPKSRLRDDGDYCLVYPIDPFLVCRGKDAEKAKTVTVWVKPEVFAPGLEDWDGERDTVVLRRGRAPVSGFWFEYDSERDVWVNCEIGGA
jgi:hypothetical protein